MGTIRLVTIPFQTWANSKYLRNFNSKLKSSFLICVNIQLYIFDNLLSQSDIVSNNTGIKLLIVTAPKTLSSGSESNSSFALKILCKTSSPQSNISSCMVSAVHETTGLWVLSRKQKLPPHNPHGYWIYYSGALRKLASNSQRETNN